MLTRKISKYSIYYIIHSNLLLYIPTTTYTEIIYITTVNYFAMISTLRVLINQLNIFFSFINLNQG